MGVAIRPLIYLADTVIPSTTANSVHIMKICEAFSAAGHAVELWVPEGPSQTVALGEIFAYYHILTPFKVCFFKRRRGALAKLRQSLEVVRSLKKRNHTPVYTRDLYTSVIAVNLGLPVIFEWHHFRKNYRYPFAFLYRRFLQSDRLKHSVVITQALGEQLQAAGIAAEAITVVPDAASPPSCEEQLDLEGEGRYQVGYLGHLYPGKGMEIIAQLPSRMPQVDFHIVGGRQADIDQWKQQVAAPNLHFHGHISQASISKYLNAFDCCLLPNQQSVKTSGGQKMDIGKVTSPLKMFDYMAHAKPIIASDLPVLREVLHDDIAVFCAADQVAEWKAAIEKLQAQPDLAKRMGQAAQAEFIQQFSWQKRAQRIYEIIKHYFPFNRTIKSNFP